jgi:hypothetical protein
MAMTERPDDEAFVHEEEEAAAEEAAHIGGPGPDYETDEAHRPLEESGEGESEGFEDAERELIENASHEDSGASALRDQFPPEEESDRSTAEYGEADEAIPEDE